tara:strand:+ start:24215 stop:24835 length:621 start_codon:yes stop_codon:yes gene_type:complete
LKHNLTIKNKQFSKYQVKGSKYFSFAFPVNDISKLKYYLQNLKIEHKKSSHICYAYRLLIDKQINDFSTDAGEPRGSAGIPILNVLKRNKLINTAIFVVRYYGGTKLGIPGLISSYSQAANDVISNINIIKYVELVDIEFYFEMKYSFMIDSIIKKYDAIFIKKFFFNKVNYVISIQEKYKSKFVDDIKNSTKNGVNFINNSFDKD